MTNYFEELAAVDCSAHVEKKGRFTYLSWPFAFAELFKRFPKAEIEVHEWDGLPMIAAPKGYMVKVSVIIDGIRRTQWHPILDNNNRTIASPDVFQINTSIQRATVKAIALHGLGLYIYAGEDLPAGAQEASEASGPVGQPNSDAWEQAALIGWDREKIEAIGRIALEWWEAEDVPGAADYLDQQGMPHEAKIAVATMFESKFRTALKKLHAERNPK